MAIRRWDPLRDLLDLQERVNRLFEQSLSRGYLDEPRLPSAGWVPLADVCETPEAFLVQLELPGVERSDMEIHADNLRVDIRGRRRLSKETRPDSFHRLERTHGPFQRTIHLTHEIDPDAVVAQLHDGVLDLQLPKLNRPQARRIHATKVE
jgi:HSP20 family protein